MAIGFVPKRKRSSRVCVGGEEEEYYMHKIQQLVDLTKRKLQDSNKNEVTLKRRRSLVEEEDDQEMKKSVTLKRRRLLVEEEEEDDQEMKKVALKRRRLLLLKKKKKKKAALKRRRLLVKKKKEKVELVCNEVTERLKEFITEEMKGSEVKVVIQKELYASDLKKSQNRLSMPLNQLETHDFLTADEKRMLERGEEFEVGLLGPRLKMHEKPMVLRMWKMEKTDNYVLKTNWNGFKEENQMDLKEQTMVQVWSFRLNHHRLCLALACLHDNHLI